MLTAVSQGGLESMGDAINVVVCHGGEEWQAQASVVECLGPWEVAIAGADMLLVPGLQMDRNVMDLAADVACCQEIKHLSAACGSTLNLSDEQVVR